MCLGKSLTRSTMTIIQSKIPTAYGFISDSIKQEEY